MQKLWPRLLRINIIGIFFQLSLKLGQKVALRVSPATWIRTDSFLVLTSWLVHSTLFSHTFFIQFLVGSFNCILPHLLHPTPASFIQLYSPTSPPPNSWLVHSTLLSQTSPPNSWLVHSTVFSHTSSIQLLVGSFNCILPHLLHPTPGWFIQLYSPTPPPPNPL